MVNLSQYKPDIDGLRAVAVLLVLAFHLNLGVPGGYIGVDVFFVISGFLITGIIKNEIDQKTFTFSNFYIRRARRILPAFFAVLLASTVAALFILLPSDLERYGKSVVATFFSVSNFWFWSQGGYFGAASEMAPLLHTWSLAVEEQFYLFLPILLLLCIRFKSNFVRPFVVISCLGTFIASAYYVTTRTPEVFYFTPFRAWELLLGSCLVLYRLPVISSRIYREFIAIVGFLLIIGPAFFYTSNTVFPGPAALLPCAGTALLIWIGRSGESIIRQGLSHNTVVFFGLISYSIYLWHWPLFVFAKHIWGDDLAVQSRLFIGFLSLIIAALSWKFIEKPFRGNAFLTNQKACIFTGLATVLLTTFVTVVLLGRGLESRFTPDVVALDRARAREAIRPECINLRVPLNGSTVCHIGSAGNPVVLIWGDSYSHAMLPAFDSAFKRLGIPAWFLAESGCPPLPATSVSFGGRENWRCREFNQKAFDFAVTQTELRQVVLVAAWDFYVNESSGYKLRIPGSTDSRTALKQGVEDLAQRLQEKHLHDLIVLGQVPTYARSVPHEMLVGILKGERVVSLHQTREDWRAKSVVSRGIFENLANTLRLTYVDSSDWFCGDGVCQFANENGVPLYWDSGHLNKMGAQFIDPHVEVVFSNSGTRNLR